MRGNGGMVRKTSKKPNPLEKGIPKGAMMDKNHGLV